MDRQRRCCKGPCHDVFFREAPWGASARRSRHPLSSRFSRCTVSWWPSPPAVAWAHSNRCSRSSPVGRTTTSCRSGFPSRMSWGTSLKHQGDRWAVNTGSILTSAIAPSHCTYILSVERMRCVGILAAWTSAWTVLPPSWPPHCQSTPWQGCPLLAFQRGHKCEYKTRAVDRFQDRGRRQASRQGAVVGQVAQDKGAIVRKTTVWCKDKGCLKKKSWPKRQHTTQPLVFSGEFHLPGRIETPRTCTGAGYGVPKMCYDGGGGGVIGLILFGRTSPWLTPHRVQGRAHPSIDPMLCVPR